MIAAFAAYFNTAADADFSLASRGATTQGGAGITSGKQGVPCLGEIASEALDLGLRDPVVAAGVQYEVPLADLRSGTIDLWIRTGYDWLKRYETPDQTEEYSVLVIPLVGGVHNVISLYLERPGTGGQGDTGMVEMKSTLIFHLSISLNLFRLPWSRGRCLGEGSSERLGSGTRTFGERRGNHPYREWHHTGRT